MYIVICLRLIDGHPHGAPVAAVVRSHLRARICGLAGARGSTGAARHRRRLMAATAHFAIIVVCSRGAREYPSTADGASSTERGRHKRPAEAGKHCEAHEKAAIARRDLRVAGKQYVCGGRRFTGICASH